MENVAYLEVDDFNSDGSIKHDVNNGKPVVLMAQGGFCGYCQQAKPAFAKFAAESTNVIAATIVTDGEAVEKQAAKFIRVWDAGHKGVPAYFGFGSNGKFEKLHGGGRGLSDLKSFAATL